MAILIIAGLIGFFCYLIMCTWVDNTAEMTEIENQLKRIEKQFEALNGKTLDSER